MQQIYRAEMGNLRNKKQKKKKSDGSKSGQWENLNHDRVITKVCIDPTESLEIGWPFRVILNWARGLGLCTLTLTSRGGKEE